ncbi:glutamic acid-rich protein-like [Helianthus annuus]|uniref:glutamic acid-rich protein-like n=1 Tax=Helianthus annuus TaxID=4232 RepID=UPI0016530AB2|nr:glutamic acid-rich protein-like [Helianthus annuus]
MSEPNQALDIVHQQKEQVATTEDDPFNVDMLFDTDVLETGPSVEVEAEHVVEVEAEQVKGKGKVIDDIEGGDVNKDTTSSSSSSDEEVVDETERLRRIQEATEQEKLLKKRKRQEKDDDDVYVPSPEHVSESQSPPGGKKKGRARNKVVFPKIRKATPKIKVPKIVLKKKQTKETKKPPTPPHEPTPPQSPIQSTPRQPTPPQQPSPPKQPTPPRQPSPLRHSPPPQQTLFTSQELFQTPPLTQMQPGFSSKGLYTPYDNLEDIGDFGFANNEQVLKLEKRMDEVLVENKKLAAENKKVSDREKILEMCVKKLEIDNKELVKKIDSNQSEIDILKVRVAEQEEEKTRRDEQNEYFKLKNKELEAAKAFRDHEFYMLNKVVESMLGTSVEQKFEQLQVEELRAERQAKIDEQMKEKGKGVEGSSAVTERSIVPSMVVDNPEPISAISGLFEDYTPMDELIGDSDEDDEEEEDEEEDVTDEKSGGTGLKVTEASAEQNVDNLMNDSVNEESGGADRQGESGDAENVQQAEKLILRIDTYREEGEHFHTYTLEFEEELNAFDINQQRDYEYKYVEDADMYDRVKVEDWTDDENVSEDTSQLPTLMEFFIEENRDELRRKVAEILKDKL